MEEKGKEGRKKRKGGKKRRRKWRKWRKRGNKVKEELIMKKKVID